MKKQLKILKIIIPILLLVIIIAILYPYNYYDFYAEKHETFSINHIFGTDYLGRDFFARVCLASFNSFIIALVSIICSIFIGGIIGMMAGCYSNGFSKVIVVLLNIIDSIPEFLIAMLLLTVFNSYSNNLGLLGIIITLILVSWTNIARIIMNETKKIFKNEYIQYSKRNGANFLHISKYHLYPNLKRIIIVTTLQKIPEAIFLESFLSFVGIGIQPPYPSLGRMISEGIKFFRVYPRELFIPCLSLITIVFAFNYISFKMDILSSGGKYDKKNY